MRKYREIVDFNVWLHDTLYHQSIDQLIEELSIERSESWKLQISDCREAKRFSSLLLSY